MKKKTEIVEEPIFLEDEEGKVIPFEKIKQLKPLPRWRQPPTNDWLSDMEIGTYFIAGERSDCFLQEYKVIDKKNKIDSGVVVILELRQGNNPQVPVDPPMFCQRFRLVAIRGKYIEDD